MRCLEVRLLQIAVRFWARRPSMSAPCIMIFLPALVAITVPATRQLPPKMDHISLRLMPTICCAIRGGFPLYGASMPIWQGNSMSGPIIPPLWQVIQATLTLPGGVSSRVRPASGVIGWIDGGDEEKDAISADGFGGRLWIGVGSYSGIGVWLSPWALSPSCAGGPCRLDGRRLRSGICESQVARLGASVLGKRGLSGVPPARKAFSLRLPPEVARRAVATWYPASPSGRGDVGWASRAIRWRGRTAGGRCRR